MRNNFQIVALQEKEFHNLFLMNEEELKKYRGSQNNSK